MAMRTALAACALLFLLSCARAEERLGVPVYPGAKYDQDRTELLRDSLGVRGAAYRTGDPIENVIAFYRKQGLVMLKVGGSEGLARFKKEDRGTDVVVQSSWKDPKTGATAKDTLILIFKRDEKTGPAMSL